VRYIVGGPNAGNGWGCSSVDINEGNQQGKFDPFKSRMSCLQLSSNYQLLSRSWVSKFQAKVNYQLWTKSVQENGGMMNKEMVTGMQVLSTDSTWNGEISCW
jgi:hypothetical protein